MKCVGRFNGCIRNILQTIRSSILQTTRKILRSIFDSNKIICHGIFVNAYTERFACMGNISEGVCRKKENLASGPKCLGIVLKIIHLSRISTKQNRIGVITGIEFAKISDIVR